MTALLEAALVYAPRTIPLPPRSKAPVIKDWPNWQATSDKIREHWGYNPEGNVGIRTGRGLVVLDIDPRAGGDKQLAALEAQHGKLPATVECVTGGGGRHLYFRGPADLRSRDLAPGVEIKAEGRQVVAPPSVHPETGRAYEWANGRRLSCREDIAEMPAWLASAAGTAAPGRDLAEMFDNPPTEGARHTELLRFVGKLLASGLESGDVLAVARGWNAALSSPLPIAEVERAVRDIAAKEKAKVWGADRLELASTDGGDRSLPAKSTRPRDRIRLVNMAEGLSRPPKPTLWTVDRFVRPGLVTLLAGRGGAGKSALGMQACASVQAGRPVAGMDTVKGTAVYVDGEQGEELMVDQFRSIGFPADAFTVLDVDGLDLGNEVGVAALEERLRELGATFVVIDSLRRLTPGKKESDSDDMAPVVARLGSMARRLTAGVLLLHHSGRDETHVSRGSTAISDQADIVMGLKAKGDTLVLHCDPATDCKIRGAANPEDRYMRLAYDGGGVVIHAAGGSDDGWRPSVLMTVISKALEAEDGLNLRAIRDATKGWGKDAVGEALNLLIGGGFVRCEVRGVEHCHYLVRPYPPPDKGTVADRGGTVAATVPQPPMTVARVGPPYVVGGHAATVGVEEEEEDDRGATVPPHLAAANNPRADEPAPSTNGHRTELAPHLLAGLAAPADSRSLDEALRDVTDMAAWWGGTHRDLARRSLGRGQGRPLPRR
jgi:hypothetical protein